MRIKKYIPGLILLIHIAALLLYHATGYSGHFGYDDLHYARLAADFNQGRLDYNDHYSYRFPVIVLTAFSYRIFGISDFASSFPPLIITILILTVIFKILKNQSWHTLTVGLSLTLFSSWFIFYSDKLMPDIYLAFGVIIALFIIHQYRFGNQKHPVLYAICLALSLLFGFMTKETILLILPLLMYLAITDLLLKRHQKFWIYSAVSGFLLLSIYFIFIWTITGNVATRFEAILSNSYLNLCSYDKQPFKMVLERISYGFLNMLLYHGMLTGFIIVLVFALKKNPKSYIRFDDSLSFWIVCSFILFLSSNFMTISVTSYSPMCLDPRHYLFLVPVVAIPAALILNDHAGSKHFRILLFVVFTLAAIFAYQQTGDSFWFHYLPLAILFLLFISKLIKPWFFTVGFVAILSLMPIKSILYARKVNYPKQREIVIHEILEKHPDALVITDEVQKRLGNYFKMFNPDYLADFLSFDEFNLDSVPGKEKILITNWYTQYLSGTNNDNLPYFVKEITSSEPAIFEDKQLLIAFFQIKTDGNVSPGVTLISSLNDFESSAVYWDLNGNEITETQKFDGQKALKLNEFSSVFAFPLDSLPLDQFGKILISSRVYCNFSEKTKANLVFSVENEKGSYYWQGQPVDQFVKAYANWWPAKFERVIKTSEIKKGSILKVYVWNIDKQEGFIDHFEVSISGLP